MIPVITNSYLNVTISFESISDMLHYEFMRQS